MKRALLLIFALSGVAFPQETPKTMTKVEVILQSPDVPPGSFASKPKVIYRAGNRYCRIEEAADPDKGIHGLVIISEPDAWMVNLITKTARHSVDPGPTFNCRLPIFPDAASNLEFGLELEFFKSKGATPTQGPVLQTKQTIAYRLDVGDSSLALFTYGDAGHPLAVARIHAGKNEIMWFSGYGQVDFDPRLFTLPQGIKSEDMKR